MKLSQKILTGAAHARSNLRYQNRIKALFGSSLIGYWPLNDTSGLVAVDASGNGRDGSYTGPTLGQTGIGDGGLSPSFDGVNDYGTIYSNSLRDAFSVDEGTIFGWAKMVDATPWTDGGNRFFTQLGNSGLTRPFSIGKHSSNYGLQFRGAGKSLSYPGYYFLNWCFYALTWSVSNNRVRCYVKGILVASDTGIVAGGVVLNQGYVGAATAGAWFHKGNAAHVGILNREATADEVYGAYASLCAPVRISVIGDSISAPNSLMGMWPMMVADQYNSGLCSLISHAVGGNTIMANMDAQVTAAASDSANKIIVEMGTNDSETGEALTNEYLENLNELKASNPSAAVYCMGILPRTDMTNVAAKNARIEAAATAAGAAYWDTTGWIDPATDTSDGVHPNFAGHSKIVTQVLARL